MVFPYLLRNLSIVRANQVWATDITYIKLGGRKVYLFAYIDIYSRYIVGWGLFDTLYAENSLEVLWRAISIYGKPEIINTDQGSQYICDDTVRYLIDSGIRISMNHIASPHENIYIERFWKTLKYSWLKKRRYSTIEELERLVGWYIDYYNHEHNHSGIGKVPPARLYGVDVEKFIGSEYFYQSFSIDTNQVVSKSSNTESLSLEELNLLLCKLYVRHNLRPEFRGGYILLRFGLNSRVSEIVRLANTIAPMTAKEVADAYNEFAKLGTHYDCYQFRLISLNGYNSKVVNKHIENLSLSDESYIDSLRGLFHVELFPYNEATYNRITERFSISSRVAVVQATGSGKSMLIAKLIIDNADKKTLVATPSLLVIQEIKKHLSFSSKRNITFTTYSALAKWKKSKLNSCQFHYIVCDEFHRCGASYWGKGVSRLLKANSNAKVLGTSATPIRHSDGKRNMADELFEGSIAQNLTLARAMACKILPVPIYVSGLYSVDAFCDKLEKKAGVNSEYLRKIEAFRSDWQNVAGVTEILKKHLPSDARKVLIFCKDIKHLQMVKPSVKEWFSFIEKPINLYELHRQSNLKPIFREFEKHRTGELDVMLCVNMLNEGVHTKGVDAVVLLRDTNSPTLYYQQIGRCMDVSNDRTPIIFDLVNNFDSVKVSELVREYKNECTKISKRTAKTKVELQSSHSEFLVIDHIEKFETIYNVLSNEIERWEIRLEELAEFYKTSGHFLLSQMDKSLATWVKNQRALYRLGKLSPHKKFKLEEIGFVWSQPEANWMSNFEKLKKFHAQTGHTNVSRLVDKPLHYWVILLREQCRNDKLSESQIESLNSIGFRWEALDEKWHSQYKRLVEFKAERGHTLVPPSFDQNLASWVLTQRAARKRDKISNDRIELLDSIGFEWTPKIDTWGRKVAVMKNHLTEIGKSKPTPKNKKLYDWYQKVKKLYQRGELSKERIADLRAIGLDIDFSKT